jgi:hypothetical protein
MLGIILSLQIPPKRGYSKPNPRVANASPDQRSRHLAARALRDLPICAGLDQVGCGLGHLVFLGG